MYVKVSEAASMLSVKEETVRRYIRSGILKAVKINKHYLIKRSDITDYLQTNVAGNLDISKEMLKDILKQVDDIRSNHPEEIDRLRRERENSTSQVDIEGIFNKLLNNLIPQK